MEREPWVVTYDILTRRYDERAGWVDCHTMIHFFTGPEEECRRIADASAAPTSHEGYKVLKFRSVVGKLSHWEEHLRDLEEAFSDP